MDASGDKFSQKEEKSAEEVVCNLIFFLKTAVIIQKQKVQIRGVIQGARLMG